MRTHFEIIKTAGGPHAVAAAIHESVGGELATLQSRVRGWSLQGSIPAEYWPMIEERGFATLKELANAQEARKLPDVAAARLESTDSQDAA